MATSSREGPQQLSSAVWGAAGRERMEARRITPGQPQQGGAATPTTRAGGGGGGPKKKNKGGWRGRRSDCRGRE